MDISNVIFFLRNRKKLLSDYREVVRGDKQ